MKLVVLGYGTIGSVVVKDLYDFYPEAQIIVAGRDIERAKKSVGKLGKKVSFAKVDIGNKNELASLLGECETCINCVQYYFNVQIMEACITAKVNYIDLGGLYHVSKKQLKLQGEFDKIGKVAVIGCGSSPGITNVLARYAASKMKNTKEMHISFGDKDFTKYNQPFVLPYSMQTLFDEFSMEPAVLKKGKIIFEKVGSGRKEITFPKPVGKLEGFYTIHSELATFPKSFGLKECSFRVTFPADFIDKINFLIDTGFSSENKIKTSGSEVVPKNFTAKIMDQWIPKNVKVDDVEFLRVEAIGEKKITMDCLARSSKKYSVPAGVYNTAVAPCIAAHLISKGQAKGSGVLPPENAFSPEDFFKELAKRKMEVFENGRKIN